MYKTPNNPASNFCKGYQPPRWVDPAACAWHLREKDTKCEGCEVRKAEDGGQHD